MKIENVLLNAKHFYFIGIGGINMSALALYLRDKGYKVSGSDINPIALRGLKKRGINVFNGHSAKNLCGADCVVYTSAISPDNEELLEAKRQGATLIKRSGLLGEILSKYKLSIAVSGSHGKTTTTDMIANVLIENNLNPTVFLGGEDKSFLNFRLGESDIALTEACEYQKNFLDIKPKLAVVLNIDNDHMDTYATMGEEVLAFSEFVRGAIAIVNADDENAKKIFNLSTITFGIQNSAVYTAKSIRHNGKGYSFTLYVYGKKIGRIDLKIDGKHNVYNALGAIAVCDNLKIPFMAQKRSLEKFCGVKRRNEFLGRAFNLDVFADYAHHPSELKAMISTYSPQKRYITVFQPHTYSRTKFLMNEFIKCFKTCSPLIILKTYPAREKYDKKGSAKTLYENIYKENKNVYYAQNKRQLGELISWLCPDYDAVMFFGAGDVYQIAVDLVKNKKT